MKIIVIILLAVMTGALMGISFNIGKLINKRLVPEIITHTVYYYNGEQLPDCPLASKLPCNNMQGGIQVEAKGYWDTF